MSASSQSVPATSASAPLGLRRGVEKPKPLRIGAATPSSSSTSATPATATVTAKLSDLDYLVTQLTPDRINPNVAGQINALLKAHGREIEDRHKDRMDLIQAAIHAACRESRIDKVSKLNLLEVIELRAMHWVPNDKVENYYKQKLAESVSAPPSSVPLTPTTAGNPLVKEDCNQESLTRMRSSNQGISPQPTFKGDHKFEVAVGEEKIYIYGSNANLVRDGTSFEAQRAQRSLQRKRLSAPLVTQNLTHPTTFWGSSSQSRLSSNENVEVGCDSHVKTQISMFEKIALESAPSQKYYREEASTVFEDFEMGGSSFQSKLVTPLPNAGNILKSNTGTSKLASAMTMSTRKCETTKSRRSYDHYNSRYSLDFQQSTGQDMFTTSDPFQEPFAIFQGNFDSPELQSLYQGKKKLPPPKPRRTSLGQKGNPPVDISRFVGGVQEFETSDASKSFGSHSSKEAFLDSKDATSVKNGISDSYSVGNYIKNESLGVKILDTKLEFELKKMENAIATAVLPSGNIIVTVAGDDHLHMYNSCGKLIKKIRPITRFRRPTDLALLNDGHFVVRTESAVCLFDADGNLVRLIGEKNFAKCFGLASDGQNHLIAINIGTNKSSSLTKPGDTDILFVDVKTGRISRRIELSDIIEDKSKSSCRFVSCDGSRIFVIDSGLDCVYAIDISTNLVKTYGSRGNQLGRFVEPTSMAIDKSGNILIADSKNHRLQIFDKSFNFVGIVKTPVALRRPTFLALDPCSPSILVVNSWSNSLLKLTFE